jgi:rubrerythrin
MASKKLLNLIIEAMKDEKYDREKYRLMIEMTHRASIRKQLEFAYVDEGLHYEMFRELYYELTGEYIDVPTPKVKLAETLIANVKASIDGELAAVEMYHEIYSLLSKRSQRDMVLGILQDEQEHATRLVYIFAMLTP